VGQHPLDGRVDARLEASLLGGEIDEWDHGKLKLPATRRLIGCFGGGSDTNLVTNYFAWL
jgi:hypothetical protein